MTRFQVEVTLNAQWRERYRDLTDTNLVSVHTKVSTLAWTGDTLYRHVVVRE